MHLRLSTSCFAWFKQIESWDEAYNQAVSSFWSIVLLEIELILFAVPHGLLLQSATLVYKLLVLHRHTLSLAGRLSNHHRCQDLQPGEWFSTKWKEWQKARSPAQPKEQSSATDGVADVFFHMQRSQVMQSYQTKHNTHKAIEAEKRIT